MVLTLSCTSGCLYWVPEVQDNADTVSALYRAFKGTVSREKCSNRDCGGFRLGPTDVLHPFLNLYTLPVICYKRLKTTFIKVKRISPLFKPRMHVTVSVS